MQAFLQFMKDNKKEAILSDDLFKKGLTLCKTYPHHHGLSFDFKGLSHGLKTCHRHVF